MRYTAIFPIDDADYWKPKLLYWAAKQDFCAYLDCNGHQSPLLGGGWELLVAVGAARQLELSAGHAFESLKAWQAECNDWLFGGFAYDLKNEIEALSSANTDGIGFPDLFFFQPETVVGIRGNTLEIHDLSPNPERHLGPIRGAQLPSATLSPPIVLRPRISKADYLKTVQAIRAHITAGDLYEMNFCQEFYATDSAIDPLQVWEKLNRLAHAPMSAYLRWQDRYLLCASPERFLKKEGPKLISQPIKGTRRRSAGNDAAMRHELANSEKDRAENVMIVDLVRNDLSRSCQAGSVQVDELFGIYTFETVHQMISTISGQLRLEVHPIDALRQAFPPGSMTGAPKVMAMQLIEQYEQTRRGLYSGAIGYFEPSGDFDFNVVIRSILYDACSGYISAQVGGAIVFDSIPEQEYEECQVKANALFRALGQK